MGAVVLQVGLTDPMARREVPTAHMAPTDRAAVRTVPAVGHGVRMDRAAVHGDRMDRAVARAALMALTAAMAVR